MAEYTHGNLKDLTTAEVDFSINTVTREAVYNYEEKVQLIEHDDWSTELVFDIDKNNEGYDMSECNIIEIHYLNIGANGKTERDLYIVPDKDKYVYSATEENGETVEKIKFSWLISGTCCKYNGSVSFVIHFIKKDVDSGTVEYDWSTSINSQSIIVGAGFDNASGVVEVYSPVIQQWLDKAHLSTEWVQNPDSDDFDVSSLKIVNGATGGVVISPSLRGPASVVPGPVGPSPNITIGTVQYVDAGDVTPTVTVRYEEADVDKNNPIFDFVLPSTAANHVITLGDSRALSFFIGTRAEYEELLKDDDTLDSTSIYAILSEDVTEAEELVSDVAALKAVIYDNEDAGTEGLKSQVDGYSGKINNLVDLYFDEITENLGNNKEVSITYTFPDLIPIPGDHFILNVNSYLDDDTKTTLAQSKYQLKTASAFMYLYEGITEPIDIHNLTVSVSDEDEYLVKVLIDNKCEPGATVYFDLKFVEIVTTVVKQGLNSRLNEGIEKVDSFTSTADQLKNEIYDSETIETDKCYISYMFTDDNTIEETRTSYAAMAEADGGYNPFCPDMSGTGYKLIDVRAGRLNVDFTFTDDSRISCEIIGDGTSHEFSFTINDADFLATYRGICNFMFTFEGSTTAIGLKTQSANHTQAIDALYNKVETAAITGSAGNVYEATWYTDLAMTEEEITFPAVKELCDPKVLYEYYDENGELLRSEVVTDTNYRWTCPSNTANAWWVVSDSGLELIHGSERIFVQCEKDGVVLPSDIFDVTRQTDKFTGSKEQIHAVSVTVDGITKNVPLDGSLVAFENSKTDTLEPDMYSGDAIKRWVGAVVGPDYTATNYVTLFTFTTIYSKGFNELPSIEIKKRANLVTEYEFDPQGKYDNCEKCIKYEYVIGSNPLTAKAHIHQSSLTHTIEISPDESGIAVVDLSDLVAYYETIGVELKRNDYLVDYNGFIYRILEANFYRPEGGRWFKLLAMNNSIYDKRTNYFLSVIGPVLSKEEAYQSVVHVDVGAGLPGSDSNLEVILKPNFTLPDANITISILGSEKTFPRYNVQTYAGFSTDPTDYVLVSAKAARLLTTLSGDLVYNGDCEILNSGRPYSDGSFKIIHTDANNHWQLYKAYFVPWFLVNTTKTLA